MPHFGPDDAIARIADWQGKDVRWQELGGGITNHNYIVWVDDGAGPASATSGAAPDPTPNANPGATPGGDKYVLRIPGHGTDMFIDRDVERECMLQAAAAGVAPRVAHQIDPEGALVIEFVEGEIMHPETMVGHPERIVQAVRTVRTCHERAVFSHGIDVFEMLRRYTAIAQSIGAALPDRLQSVFAVLSDIEAAMRRDPVADVAAHNDLLSENFIVDPGGRMWIIDWEYGGMTDPWFDLGDFVMEHPFSREEERLIVETYCGTMDERCLGRMLLYKVVSAIWWAVWAMIQRQVSKIDFDYLAWGMERVARAERGIDDPDFRTWLAEA